MDLDKIMQAYGLSSFIPPVITQSLNPKTLREKLEKTIKAENVRREDWCD